MVSPLIVVSINPPKHTRGLDALSQGNTKIFSWSTLELVINKLENLVIFRNSLEEGTHVTTL